MQVATPLLALLSLVALAEALPKAKMQQILVQVEPEMLRGHKLVLTLEPLKEAPEEQLEDEVTAENPKEAETEEEKEAPKGVEEDGTEEAGPTPPPSVSSEDTPISNTKPLTIFTRRKPGGAFAPGTTRDKGVPQFVINLPDIKCPPGQRPDANGICRQPFGSFTSQPSLWGGATRFLSLRGQEVVLDLKDNEENRLQNEVERDLRVKAALQ